MTKAESEFLSILKNAVHPDPSFTIDNPDWEGIMNTARKQNLLSFVFDASQNLPGYEAIEEKYFEPVAAQVAQQAQKTADFLQLYKAFLSDGLSPIVLKGIICRDLYGEKADFRVSGDEDVLVAKKDYQKAVQTLNRCGYTTDEVPDKDLELVQEITFINPESPLTIELHLNPFGSGDTIRAGMNEWFRNVFDSKETAIFDGVPVRTLEPTDHMLFLILHAFKHFIYEGFGIRLLLDILLFAEKHSSCIEWEYVYEGLKDNGSERFYNDLIVIGDTHLGFKLDCGEKTSPDELIEDMFRMGTFGNTTNSDKAAALFTSDIIQRSSSGKEYSSSKFSRIYRMFQRIFPSWRTWTCWRPYLKDKPWMVVPEWFKRVGRYFRHETSMGNLSEINESYEIAEHRIELLKKYKVI